MMLTMTMVKEAISEGRNGRPLPEGAFLLFPAVAILQATLFYKSAASCTTPYVICLLKALRSCRRAAHFAHFGADDEEEDGDNLHTGGTEVC